jgi:tripartite-type tricarboxylate transporter receptor subunit TctC
MNRRQVFSLAAGAALLPWLPRPALAQSPVQPWPTRPVRIVVGYPPGIAPDIVARLVGERLSSRLSQQFIVDNRPGAGTNIAAENVVRAPADGYTLLLVAAANAINMALNPNLGFNFIADIAPVASLGGVVFIMAVNPSFPAKTLGEFIAYAKANPGKINIASRGIGSSTHVFGEMFKMMASVDLVHVPYRNDYKADLLGGRVQVAFFAIADALGDVRDGTIRALAVTNATRFAALPEVPTISEIVPGYAASGWLGIGAPKNTPAAVVEKLNGEINAVLADPALNTRLLDMGIEPDPMSVAKFSAFIAADADRWAKVVRFADIKPE